VVRAAALAGAAPSPAADEPPVTLAGHKQALGRSALELPLQPRPRGARDRGRRCAPGRRPLVRPRGRAGPGRSCAARRSRPRRPTTWGHQRIRGESLKLGCDVSAMAIRVILRRHGLRPAPQRARLSAGPGARVGGSAGPRPTLTANRPDRAP
jgi:hypothetical protein